MDEDFAREVDELRKRAQRVEDVMQELPVLPDCKGLIRNLACDVVAIASIDYPVVRGDKAAIRALHLLGEQLQKTRDMINALPAEAEQVLVS